MDAANTNSTNGEPTGPSSASPPSQAFGRRVNRSCIECTRRKIKCDGRFPCSSCVYYRAAEACEYRQRSRRNAVSRSAHEDVVFRLKRHEDILSRLFPGYSLAQLEVKSRPQLLQELGVRDSVNYSHERPGPLPQQSSLPRNDSGYPGEDDSAPLSENGDAAPEPQWDESLDKRETVATDDINAIGLATDKKARTYLGISSMSAAFRTIFRLYPPTKDHTAARARACADAPPPPNQLSVPALTRDPALSLLREQRCIDFYFDHFHAVTPFVDEEDFRKQYATGGRRDGSWLGMLNMVFALGSIASGSESLHDEYYKAARASFSLDSLGSGNLYSLQALMLLGGYYLHYRNSPNMAYGILGAAHRVAIALGLHREPRRLNITDPEEVKRAEIRRRTWWSLFCLDSWACMTQGRPTCGRWEQATMDTALPMSLHGEDYAAMSLRASAEFCLICDRIQNRLARLGRLTPDEILAFDQDLLTFYAAMPSLLKQVDTAAHPRVQVAREFIRTRYHNARVIVARCCVLLMAQNWRRKIVEDLLQDQRQTLERCCTIAADAIDAIALYWTPNRFLVWSSGWYLFQACTVPLLAMAMERNLTRGPGVLPHGPATTSRQFAAWQESLAKALGAFSEMRAWMRNSDRSPDIVSAMYEALTADTDAVVRTPSASDGSLDLFGLCDEQLTEMDWGMFLGDENLPTDMMPLA